MSSGKCKPSVLGTVVTPKAPLKATESIVAQVCPPSKLSLTVHRVPWLFSLFATPTTVTLPRLSTVDERAAEVPSVPTISTVVQVAPPSVLRRVIHVAGLYEL